MSRQRCAPFFGERKPEVKMFLSATIATSALLVAGCATSQASQPAEPAATAPVAPRVDHTPDLGSLITRFLSPQGYMDPAFPPTVAKPSRYLSDFYGVQALKDVPKAAILKDFVPRLATKLAEDENSVTLQFAAGYTAKFFPNSNILAAGQKLAVSHVEISGDTWQALGANLADFRGKLAEAGLEQTYLIPNKFYNDEVATFKQMNTGKVTPIRVDPDLAAFRSSRNGVLLLPEGVHGRPEDVTRAMEILGQGKIDWIGMEMLNADQQPMLDAFNAAKKGTPSYATARQALVDYFAVSWNGRAGPKTTGEENYYMKLAEAAHDNGTRVIGIEASSIEYIFFRFGETQFGAAVRNLWWANALPKEGRGIVFGGSAHFDAGQPVNVQDFLTTKVPGRPMFSLNAIEKKKTAG